MNEDEKKEVNEEKTTYDEEITFKEPLFSKIRRGIVKHGGKIVTTMAIGAVGVLAYSLGKGNGIKSCSNSDMEYIPDDTDSDSYSDNVVE